MKKAICLLLCLFLTLSCVGCGGKGDETTAGTTSGAATYTVTVKNQGDAPLAGIGVYVYTDETKADLIWFAKTDDNGAVSFSHQAGESCVIVLDSVPAGYKVEEFYTIDGEAAQIVLETEMSEVGDLTGVTYHRGDVIGDFSVTAPDGTVYNLSELLAQKKIVVLNFWYLECQPCKSEFPHLQEAYEKYGEQIALLAMNPVNTDGAAIASYQSENGITFPMVQCDPAWESAMQLTAYPTTVVIDSYGTISLIHSGMVSSAEEFFGLLADYIDVDIPAETDPTEPDTSEATEPETEPVTQPTTEPATEPSTDPSTAPTEKDEPTTTPTTAPTSPTEPEEISPEEAATLMAGNPTDAGTSDFDLVVVPGYEAEVNIYRVSGKMYLNIDDKDAYVIYNGKTYKASNGKVSVTISASMPGAPVIIKVGNSGTATKTFTVTFTMPKGSWDNPYDMKIGETFEVSVPSGSEQGVYYAYTATESGILTLECLSATAGVEYTFSLYNLNSYEMNFRPDGSVTVSIAVNQGDVVKINIGTITDADNNSYPAADFEFIASFTKS